MSNNHDAHESTAGGYRVTAARELPETQGNTIRVPAESKFNQVFHDTERGRGTLGNSHRRRSMAARPTAPHGVFATAHRPGGVLAIDSSPLDVFTLDEITGATYRLDLLNCIDLDTASVGSFRFTTRGPKAIDAVFVLTDALTGRLFKPHVQSHEPRYVGIPDRILLDERVISYRPRRRRDPRPRAFPADLVVADHGLIYPSATFTDACDLLYIDVQLARLKRPTDKPHVESLFSSINSSFAQLFAGAGYTGSGVHERGRDPEADACFFAWEIERFYEYWIEHFWQEHVPEGQQLSPNQRYDIGIARAGYVTVPLSKTLYLELLPKKWVTIGDRGARLDGLVYDDPSGAAFRGCRNQRSDYSGKYPGKWPIARDTRDLSKAWFRNPETGWHELQRRGSNMPTAAFTDVQLSEAKSIIKIRGGDTKNDLELSRTVDELCYLIWDARLTGGDRRKAIQARYNSSQATRDLTDALEEARREALASTAVELDEDSQEFAVEFRREHVDTVDYEGDEALTDFLNSAGRGFDENGVATEWSD